MVRMFFLLLLALTALAQAPPTRQITSQATLVGNQLVPGFQNGYLFFLEAGSIHLYSPEGFSMPTLALQIPDAAGASAMGLAIDTDRSVAVSYGYKTSVGYGSGIAFFDRNGQPTGSVDTGRYLASNLSFGENHCLWTFG